MNYIKNLITFITICTRALIDIIRPALGPTIPSLYSPCIYYMDCRTYAHHMLQTKSIIIALPIIFFRTLSCNPITGIGKWLYTKLKSKQKGLL